MKRYLHLLLIACLGGLLSSCMPHTYLGLYDEPVGPPPHEHRPHPKKPRPSRPHKGPDRPPYRFGMDTPGIGIHLNID